MIKSYSVYPTAAAADLTLAKGILKIANTTDNKFPLTGIPYDGMTTGGIVVAVTEVLQVDTITPTAANSTEYTLTLTQLIDGEIKRKTFSHTSPASGATATTICNAFRSMINASSEFQITASGTTTLVLTADAGYSQFKTTAVTSNLALVNTTAGVYPKGQGADLIAAGIEDAVSGQAYDAITFEYLEALAPAMGDERRRVVVSHTVYMDNDSGDYATVTTGFKAVLTDKLDLGALADVTDSLEKI